MVANQNEALLRERRRECGVGPRTNGFKKSSSADDHEPAEGGREKKVLQGKGSERDAFKSHHPNTWRGKRVTTSRYSVLAKVLVGTNSCWGRGGEWGGGLEGRGAATQGRLCGAKNQGNLGSGNVSVSGGGGMGTDATKKKKQKNVIGKSQQHQLKRIKKGEIRARGEKRRKRNIVKKSTTREKQERLGVPRKKTRHPKERKKKK